MRRNGKKRPVEEIRESRESRKAVTPSPDTSLTVILKGRLFNRITRGKN
jgi:hypothetical protein